MERKKWQCKDIVLSTAISILVWHYIYCSHCS